MTILTEFRFFVFFYEIKRYFAKKSDFSYSLAYLALK